MAIIQKFKKKLIGHLEKHELYFRFKYSSILFSLLKKKNQNLKRTLEAEFKLYKSVLHEMPSNGLIFDIGANLGYTTKIFDSISGTVIAVEPDSINLNCLRARHGRNQNIKILPKAISDKIGEEKIYLQDYGDSLHTLSSKWKTYLENNKNDRWNDSLNFSKSTCIQTTTLDELIKEYGIPYFIKIDVEGYEEKVLKGLTNPIPLISFEANLPEFLEETIACIEYLNKLDTNATFNYSNFDKLIMPQYVHRDNIIDLISKTSLRCIDVYCKM